MGKNAKERPVLSRGCLWVAMGFMVLVTVLPWMAWAQKEVTSGFNRSRVRETKSRYYGEFEKRPGSHLPVVEGRTPRKAFITMAPTAEKVRRRHLLADSHEGLKFYNRRTWFMCSPSTSS